MMSMTRIGPACLLAALLVLTACGGDDGGGPKVPVPVPFDGEMMVPDAWRGVWEMTFDLVDETTGKMHTQTVWQDTLCAGDTLSVSLGPLMGACDGYVKGDSLVFAAQDSWDEGSCTVTLILELRARRQGDVVSGAGEWRMETTGTCGAGGSVVGRDLIELNGVRTAPVAAGDCP
ncbi:MAG: hypothetical protein GY838_01105 [bacterium]|nr:hypothetical protein [bacterium]